MLYKVVLTVKFKNKILLKKCDISNDSLRASSQALGLFFCFLGVEGGGGREEPRACSDVSRI